MTLVTDAIECDDKRFYSLIFPDACIDELYSSCLWAEGSVWFSEGQALIWSDIPNQQLLKWTKKDGVSVFRAKSNFANGNTRDVQGRLVTCEHGKRRVTRTENDGSITIIVDNHIGKKLNSPNDLVVKSDGSIWFTDPNYGIMSNFEGYRADMEQKGCYVYRVGPESREAKIVADDFVKPNGLAFSEDEKTLYIADSARSHDPNGPHHIRAFDVGEDGKLRNNRVFCEVETGVPDGFCVDIYGHIWTSCKDGVVCFDEGGTQLGKIKIPQTVANLTFGGVKRDRLFITATKSLYAVYVASFGIQRP